MSKLERVVVALLLAAILAPVASAAITGAIVDSDSKPVVGATIRAFAAEETTAMRARWLSGNTEREPLASATSSDTGAFSLDVQGRTAVDVVIVAPGHARYTLGTVDGDDLGAILLGPVPLAKVRVTSGGKPVVNAIVVSGSDVSRTDASGEVPLASNGPLFVIHPDFAIGVRRDVANTMLSIYEVKLTRGTPMRGRVINVAGPVPHAAVSINGWPLAESADDGTFSIAHAPESWQSVLAVHGSEIGSAVRSKATSADVRLDIRMNSGASFTGVLRDSRNGSAVSGARMTSSAMDDVSPMTVISDSKGRFTFGPLLPQVYEIRGTHPAFAIDGAAVSLRHVATRAFSALAFATARGRVIDEDKKPIAGAMVSTNTIGASRPRYALTNAGGEFTLRILPVSTNRAPLYASKRDYVTSISELRTWQPGETRDGFLLTLARGFVFQVRVIDRQRQPVARAFVNVARTGENALQGLNPPAACADPLRADCHRTGPDGIVSFRSIAGGHAVFVSGDDIAPRRFPNQALDARSEPVLVQVDRGVEISGHVLRADGTPVSGAVVETPVARMPPRSTTSDASGAFTLLGVPAGVTPVTALSADRRLSSPVVSVTAPAKDVTLKMPQGAKIEGRVTDRATKQPVPDFTISFPSRRPGDAVAPQAVHTDDGTYAIENITPGIAQIVISASGYVSGSRNDIVVEDSKTAGGVDVQLDRGASATGRVTSAGAPLAGVQVQLAVTTPGPNIGGGTITDADGNYTIEGIAEGERMLQFQRLGFLTQRKPIEVTAGKELHLDVELEHGRELRGHVSDRSGHPIAGAYVAVEGERTMPANMTPSEADGSFAIQGLADGQYSIVARKEGYVSARVTGATVPQTGALTLTLDNGATLTGRVTGLTPDELMQVTVMATGGETRNQADVDGAGNFTMRGMPDGRLRVDAFLASPGQRRAAAPKMVVVENGSAPAVEINFDEGILIRGRVTRAGAALPGGVLSFGPTPQMFQKNAQMRLGTNNPTAMIGSDGSYSVTLLTPGDYSVRVSAPGIAFQTAYTARASGTFDIDIRGAMFRGRVVDAVTGAALSNAQVMVFSREAQSTGSASSDSEGHFAIDALSDATYSVRATREPYAPLTREVVVSGGSVPEVELRLEPAPAVTFHVVDSITGAPVDINLLISTPNHQNVSQAVRSDTGTYKAWLQPGSYIATTFTRFYTNSSTPFTTSPGDVRITVVHGGQLMIQTRSAQQVRMDPPMPRMPGTIPLTEGTNGPFPVTAPGSYALSVLDKGGVVIRVVPVNIVVGETTTIQLP